MPLPVFPYRADSPPPQARTPRRWIGIVTAVWAVAALYVAQAFLPPNVIKLPGQKPFRQVALVVAPQGWAFFTKSPREPVHVPYRQRADGSWADARISPHAKPSNAFGLDRASRSQGIEGALLVHKDGIHWNDCSDPSSPEECLKGARLSAPITNPSPSPSLCGRAALVEVKPVPFAWRDLMEGTHSVERAAVWDVTCR
ncbi:SdpA family antimicrobial peptide system protein [Streptomyces sp. HUAS MG91]|uniref:SdpA family antimicrobial peptide system protein n=1 Tax=Streptomyces tabacisoli TaxID=3156398 RepID=A0AAU8J058_9ACTN